jgi:magnesium-transporting ATPase (P-type)
MKYVFPEKKPIDASGYAGNGYASYFILFNQLIPLSLLVTLEVAKMSYSRMMEHDVEMMMIDYDLNQIQETRV